MPSNPASSSLPTPALMAPAWLLLGPAFGTPALGPIVWTTEGAWTDGGTGKGHGLALSLQWGNWGPSEDPTDPFPRGPEPPRPLLGTGSQGSLPPMSTTDILAGEVLSGVGGWGAAAGLSLLRVTTLCPSLSPSSLLSLLPRLPSNFASKSLGTLSPYSQVIKLVPGDLF